jgi:hypothetical protein
VSAYAAAGRWPDLAQVFRVERCRTIKGVTTVEVAYGITSLPPERADAARLLRLLRGHWRIENNLHHVRDVVLGEDGCRVNRGASPQVLAAMRNVAVRMARKVNKGVTAAARHWYLHPFKAIQLLDSPS